MRRDILFAWGARRLCRRRTIAGGFGNPPRVPMAMNRLRVQMCRQARVSVQAWAVCVLAWTAACSVDDKMGASSDAPAGIGSPEAGASAPEVAILVLAEPRTSDGGICSALVCNLGTSQYCGDIEDNCGQTLHCGDCPADQECNNHVCKGTNCLLACTFNGGSYCGVIGDGCGGTLDCRAVCPQTGWTCGTDHICQGDPSVCQAQTCLATSGDHYCG